MIEIAKSHLHAGGHLCVIVTKESPGTIIRVFATSIDGFVEQSAQAGIDGLDFASHTIPEEIVDSGPGLARGWTENAVNVVGFAAADIRLSQSHTTSLTSAFDPWQFPGQSSLKETKQSDMDQNVTPDLTRALGETPRNSLRLTMRRGPDVHCQPAWNANQLTLRTSRPDSVIAIGHRY